MTVDSHSLSMHVIVLLKTINMKNFVTIQKTRILKSTIKKYVPQGDKKLLIHYSPSRSRTDYEAFDFSSQQERDEMLKLLDEIL